MPGSQKYNQSALIKLLLVTGLLLAFEAGVAASNENSIEGDAELTVRRESPLDSDWITVLVILRPGQSIFGTRPIDNNKELTSDDRKAAAEDSKFPKFYKIDGSSPIFKRKFVLPEGKYQIDVILRKEQADCDFDQEKTRASCIPGKLDRVCSGERIDISRSRTAFVEVACAKGDPKQ